MISDKSGKHLGVSQTFSEKSKEITDFFQTGQTDCLQTKFYLSGSYMDQNGSLKGSEMKRYNTRINLTHKINRMVDVGVNLSVGYSETHTSDPSTGEGRYSWRNPWFTS